MITFLTVLGAMVVGGICGAVVGHALAVYANSRGL